MKIHSATIASLVALAVSPVFAFAQNEITKLQVQTRFDYLNDWDIHTENGGFSGRYFNIRLDGSFDEELTYSIRHRMNKNAGKGSYFDATDWAWVDWRFSDRWSVNAGKQVVMIGGFEYDRAPIDLFECSDFWNHIACYQLGTSVSFQASNQDRLSFQICQSPSVPATDLFGKYAYNLMWKGSHGFWDALWSVNMIGVFDYEGGAKAESFVNYISLGNRFHKGNLALELDWMNRTCLHDFKFDDFSVMAELSYNPDGRHRMFAKYSYDRNVSNIYDICVKHGTEMHKACVGMEYLPFDESDILRLHAFAGLKTVNFGITLNLDALTALKSSL